MTSVLTAKTPNPTHGEKLGTSATTQTSIVPDSVRIFKRFARQMNNLPGKTTESICTKSGMESETELRQLASQFAVVTRTPLTAAVDFGPQPL